MSLKVKNAMIGLVLMGAAMAGFSLSSQQLRHVASTVASAIWGS